MSRLIFLVLKVHKSIFLKVFCFGFEDGQKWDDSCPINTNEQILNDDSDKFLQHLRK